MKRRTLLLTAGIFLSASMFAAGCAVGANGGYSVFQPNKSEGNSDFDFPSNSFSADVKLDGFLDDERWAGEDVISLGSWNDADAESGEYGAIVSDTADYVHSKRAIIKMFRGNVGFHFGFEVKDDDVAYLSLEDGDPAIWTDNILVNLCTAIDGGVVPMSDDYYFIVTAFGNNCFRRGANVAGTWGAWSGVLDYEASLHYADDGKTVTGFGVELVVPYTQIGLKKDSPVGVTFRSCDRVSASNSMIEREWWYKGDTHHFNTPNTYIVWGGDNRLYEYYDYKMPDVTVKGTAVDYITGEALAGVTFDEGVTTDRNGNFVMENVDANRDLVLTATGESLLGEQEFSVPRDKMRVLNGGTLTVTPKLLTKKNKITQTVKGTITSLGKVEGATVKIGDAETTLSADGRYSLSCVFDRPVLRMSVSAAGSDAVYETEISIADAVKGEVEKSFELPVMSRLAQNFGTNENAECYLGWTKEGLFVRLIGTEPTNGYGVAFSADGKTGTVVLYHSFGTMCVTDFVTQSWNYAPPSSYGIDAEKRTDSRGRDVYTFVVPYKNLGVEYGAELKIAPFEYTSAGPFAWYEDENGVSYPFGDAAFLAKYPTLAADGNISLVFPETVLSIYRIGSFGKTNATALFEKVEGRTDGIRVTIDYTPTDGFWGFGVMFFDFSSGKGITQLYVPEYGTIDHREYGNWEWKDNYAPASSLGVLSSEKTTDGKASIELFYGYAVLQGEKYGLGISADTLDIGIQMFEYVLDGSGNLYAVYNCINGGDGTPLPFDGGAASFLKWRTAEDLPQSTYTYEHLGVHDIFVTLEKLADGIRLTYAARETSQLFGYGICLDLPGGAQDVSLLYATTGNLSKLAYGTWVWEYRLPSEFGVSAARSTADGRTISTLFLSYEMLGIEADFQSIGLCLFEVVNEGGSQFGIYNCMKKGDAEIAIDGGTANFVRWNTDEG